MSIGKLSVIGVFLLASAGCKLQTGVNAGGGSSGISTGGDGAGGGGGASGGGASCENPQNHCLDADDLFIGDSAFENGYITVHAAKQQGQPNATGEAAFLNLGDGATKNTKYFWKTHPMTDDEVKVGALMIALDHSEDNVYRAPDSRERATNSNWFLARIVNVDGLAQGHVLVSGGYKVARNALRAVDGDNSPRLTVGGTEDKWYVKPDYWFIANNGLPATGYETVTLAVAIKAPSAETKGEGQFMKLGTGEILWTKNAWKQRAATQADMKLGAYAIALDHSENNVYVPPTSREQALTGNWFVAKIVDVGQAYKGQVTFAGGYAVQIDGTRVIAK